MSGQKDNVGNTDQTPRATVNKARGARFEEEEPSEEDNRMSIKGQFYKGNLVVSTKPMKELRLEESWYLNDESRLPDGLRAKDGSNPTLIKSDRNFWYDFIETFGDQVGMAKEEMDRIMERFDDNFEKQRQRYNAGRHGVMYAAGTIKFAFRNFLTKTRQTNQMKRLAFTFHDRMDVVYGSGRARTMVWG